MTIDVAKKLLEKIFTENKDKDSTLMHGTDKEKRHAYLVLEWVKKLNPNASVLLKIAALFHDIDRIMIEGVGSGTFNGTSEEYKIYKKEHAQRSANCTHSVLIKNGLSNQDVDRVSFLIIHHDDSRQQLDQIKDEELEILVAADTLAFFDSFGMKIYQTKGTLKLEEKIKFMALKMSPQYRKIIFDLKLDEEVLQKAKDNVVKQILKTP